MDPRTLLYQRLQSVGVTPGDIDRWMAGLNDSQRAALAEAASQRQSRQESSLSSVGTSKMRDS